MIYLKKQDFKVKENLVTDKKIFLNRRKLILGMASFLVANKAQNVLSASIDKYFQDEVERPLTSLEVIRKYNNFFEFGTSKQIWKEAQNLNLEGWTIEITGARLKKQKIFFDDLINRFDIEERIYRFRCVETWSMVVPWNGFSLASLIRYLEPDSSTKYVEFETFNLPAYAKNQKQLWYPWPYKETITLSEALNPLSFLATGVYGESLPKQNGAPIRLVLPWKYGFKSIKSITKIRFLKNKNKSFWETVEPKEYGFWANVNPDVPHRRWSQKFEKDIGTGKKYPTKIFNGYGNMLEGLYDINDKNLFF